MERIRLSVKRETRHRGISLVFPAALCFIVFVLLSFCMTGTYGQARNDLIERLQKEKEVAEINNDLKIAHSATTRARFLELQAKRLGLKKAKEEEVLVLR